MDIAFEDTNHFRFLFNEDADAITITSIDSDGNESDGVIIPAHMGTFFRDQVIGGINDLIASRRVFRNAYRKGVSSDVVTNRYEGREIARAIDEDLRLGLPIDV